MANIITRALTVQGFTIGKYLGLYADFSREMTEWFTAGKIEFDETVVDGLDNAVDALLDQMRGANIGKMVVKIA